MKKITKKLVKENNYRLVPSCDSCEFSQWYVSTGYNCGGERTLICIELDKPHSTEVCESCSCDKFKGDQLLNSESQAIKIIESALEISDLWVPCDASEEHKGEARALCLMEQSFINFIKQHKQKERS